MRQNVIRRRMDELGRQIKDSLRDAPDDFDAREPMWMDREDLRAQLVPEAPPRVNRFVAWMGFDNHNLQTVGAISVLLLLFT